MAGQDSYSQGIVVASLTDSPNAETLARNLADAIAPRTVMRFASASARSAALTGVTAPVEGMVTWLQDTNLLYVYDGSAWQVQSSYELMAWTSLSSLGSFAGAFSAGSPTPRMRKLSVLGVEVWELEGRVNASSLAVATTTTMFTFNVGHRTANGHGYMVYNSSHYAARLTIAQTGIMSVSVPTEAGTGVSTIYLDGVRITNPAL
ncbi:DUF2793 domain-containing protein [Streptomyces bobili]|uniref:hypothetical protein n=1 Tax=Streptomyces bobili TaxID=67280 RepID=UPI002254B7D4|nr:hypothetical protein [Streptomyces bobili]MCX5522578.1 DUF2793 domain-containing protein [Streptomyces bobili]